MVNIENIQTVIARIPQRSSAQVVLPKVSQASALPVIGGGGDHSFSTEGAETVRLETLRQNARNAPQPLGSMSFTMFKDAVGQVITRFFDKNTGKAVYIPEPQLLRLAQASAGGGRSILNVNA